jgi:hypothetical protein
MLVMFATRVFPLPALIVVAVSAAAAAPISATFDRGTLNIYEGPRKVTLQVEIARTTEARSQGLMHRPTMPENAGMLFVFEDEGKWGFWMRNTLIPLSIGFIGADWRLLEIQDMHVLKDPASDPPPVYEPAHAYRYALEVNQGFFARNRITPGARLQLVTGTPKPSATFRPSPRATSR